MIEKVRSANYEEHIGGFRIIVTPEEIRVSRDNDAFSGSDKMKRTVILVGGLIASLLLLMDRIVHVKSMNGALLEQFGYLLLPVVIMSVIWFGLYPRRIDLYCTKLYVELRRKRQSTANEARKYPSTHIQKVKYAHAEIPWIGRPSHLSFSVKDKWIACLPGLRPMEGNEILNQLKRLGYDVINEQVEADDGDGSGLTEVN